MTRVRRRRWALSTALAAALVAAFTAEARGATLDVSVRDFAFSPASVEIAPGDTVRWTNNDAFLHTVTRAGMFDETLDPGESFSHTFDAVGTFSYTCSLHFGMNGTVSVVNADPDAPTLSVEDVVVAETDMNPVRFRVSLSAPAPEAGVTFHYTTTNVTAVAGLDYTAAGNVSATIPAGESETFAEVFVRGDTMDEANETFKLTLSDPNGAAIADGEAFATIVDDDAPPSVVIKDVAVREGNVGTRPANFSVRLSAPSGKRVTIAYATLNGTARAAVDYLRRASSVVFLAGQTAKVVAVPVRGERLRERNETFFVKLSAGAAANAVIADPKGRATILNDDR